MFDFFGKCSEYSFCVEISCFYIEMNWDNVNMM